MASKIDPKIQSLLKSLEKYCNKYLEDANSDTFSDEEKRKIKETCENTLEWIKKEGPHCLDKEQIIAKRENLDEICFKIITKIRKTSKTVNENEPKVVFDAKDNTKSEELKKVSHLFQTLDRKCHEYKQQSGLSNVLSAKDKSLIEFACEKTSKSLVNMLIRVKEDLVAEQKVLDEICGVIISKEFEKNENLSKNLDKSNEKTQKQHETIQIKLNLLEIKCHKYKRAVDSKELCEVLSESDKYKVKDLCEKTLEWIKNAQNASKEYIISKQEDLDECVNIIEKAKEKHAHKVLETAANQHFSDKEFEKAIETYTKLIEHEHSKDNPLLVLAYRCNRGRAFYYLGKWKEAIEDFEIWLE